MSIKQRGITGRTLSALVVLILGLGTAFIGLAGTSSAIEEVGDLPAPVISDADDCVSSAGAKAFYSDWADDGLPEVTEDNVAPTSGNPDLERYVPAGQTDPEVVTPAVGAKHYSWNGGNRGVADPPLGNVPPGADWTLNVEGFDPHLQGEGDPATWVPNDPATSGLHVVGNSPSNASWFYFVPGSAAVTDVDYTWQKQVRTLTPAVAPTQCVAGTDSDDRTLSDGDCETGTVTETFQFRLEQTPGAQDWGPWQTGDVTTRDMTRAELAECDSGGDPGDPGNPGGGEVAGNAEVLGIEANAPAAAGAPAAAPTAVDAGFGSEQPGDSSLLWLLLGGAMVVAGASIGLVPARVRGKRSW